MRRISWPFRRHQAHDIQAVALAPLTQATRCLDLWLHEENRSMTARQKQRAAALIARYLEHEDDDSDQLILSSLRHYAGMGVVDLEDPQAVRVELKAVLDRSVPQLPPSHSRIRLLVAVFTGMLSMASVLIFVYLSQQTLTLAEQHELRTAVAEQATKHNLSPATIWAHIKRDLGVGRYQDIRRWDFDRALEKASED